MNTSISSLLKKFKIFKFLTFWLVLICFVALLSTAEEKKPTTNSRNNEFFRSSKVQNEIGSNQLHEQNTLEMLTNLVQAQVSSGFNFGQDLKLSLDKDHSYTLFWNHDYKNNYITFNLGLNSAVFEVGNDVFGLGFSNRGTFNEVGDFCLVWFDINSQIHLQDAYTSENSLLSLRKLKNQDSICELIHVNDGKKKTRPLKRKYYKFDDDESLLLLQEVEKYADIGKQVARSESKPEKNKFIEVVFGRPLDDCSSSGHYVIDNGTTHLIWFHLKGPVSFLRDFDLKQEFDLKKKNLSSKIQGYGMSRVQLVSVNSNTNASTVRHKKTERESDSKVLEIKMTKYQVPTKDTTYWCKLFRLPRSFERKKYHITQYEALVESNNTHITHHMELFNCINLNKEERFELDDLYANGGWQGDCNESASKPKQVAKCRRVILAWAMGAKPLVYPSNVGQVIGGVDYNPYVVLEVHYNNERQESGILDSSGLKFHYTSNLRKFDAGVLEIGLEYNDYNSLPPKVLASLAGECHSECTRVGLSSPHHHLYHNKLDPGIYVFAAQMHTHLTGVSSWTEHIRGGILLDELQRDDHYSPHFQEIRLLPEHVHIAPGDSLVHYCLYDTSYRTNITLGGYGTKDEMCVTYMHYYPKIDLEVCKSSIDPRALAEYFNYLQLNESQKTDAMVKSIAENYHSINWSPQRAKQILNLYKQAPLSIQCDKSNGQKFDGNWMGLAPTNVWPSRLMESNLNDDVSVTRKDSFNYRGAGYKQRHKLCSKYN